MNRHSVTDANVPSFSSTSSVRSSGNHWSYSHCPGLLEDWWEAHPVPTHLVACGADLRWSGDDISSLVGSESKNVGSIRIRKVRPDSMMPSFEICPGSIYPSVCRFAHLVNLLIMRNDRFPRPPIHRSWLRLCTPTWDCPAVLWRCALGLSGIRGTQVGWHHPCF